jgi:hypothetical protein
MGYLDYHIRAHGHERTMHLPARRMARVQMQALQQQQQQQQEQQQAGDDAAEGHPEEAQNIAAGAALLHDADTTHDPVPCAVATAETEMHATNNNTQPPHKRKRPYTGIDEDDAEKHHT